MSSPTRTIVGFGLCVVLAGAGCSTDKKVGDAIDANKRGAAGGDFGPTTTTSTPAEATTTTAKPVVTTAATVTTVKASTTTRAPVATTAAPTPMASLGATAFEPQQFRVFVGQKFAYTNVDTEPRGLRHTGGAFASGKIAPGESWTFTIPQVGSYDIVDDARPFVVGKIIVVAR